MILQEGINDFKPETEMWSAGIKKSLILLFV